VLLIILDTVRVDRLGCYGSDMGLTPEIDAFAESAVRFERAFSQAPWTLPSVATLYTSQYPVQHGAGGRYGKFEKLSPELPTIAEVFRDAGYDTAAIINVLFMTETFGMTRGFLHVDAEGPDSNEGARPATETTDAALAWLDRKRERPFFMLVHYFDPHLVYDPPQPFRERFADPQDRQSTDILFGTRREMIALRSGAIDLPRDLMGRLERLYNAEIAYMDSQVGRLLDGLRERGLDERTVVVICSDHGEEFLEHGGFEHGHALYDELLHVPLLIRTPDAIAEDSTLKGKSVRSTVRLIDVAPTMCELAGVEPASTFFGESLAPLLSGAQPVHHTVLSQGNMWGPSGEAWRDTPYKIIREPSVSRTQLFDIESDPLEKNDLCERMSEVCRRMVSDLDVILQLLASRVGLGGPPDLTTEQYERLQSLGYIAGD
jgi:arylsulfatase A-like enzyme